MKPHSPPRLANWLLRWFVPATDREEIMGDLAEEFSLRVQSSNSCWSWYWGQTLSSIPPMAWKATREGRWIRTFLVALGAYIAAGLVESVADAVLLKTVNPQSLLHTVLSLIIGLTTTAGAGYVAARFRPGAETVMGAIVLVAVFLAARVGDAPLWYGLVFLIAGPLASLAGGALFPRSRIVTQRTVRISLCLIFVSSCSLGTRKGVPVTLSQEIIALERSALDRWIAFDPQGYLDLSAPEVTYFDPFRDKRVDGLEVLKVLLESIKQLKGTITEPRYEMIDPKIQQYGDVALLTYNLTNYGRVSGGPEAVLARWNSSELYARVGERWKLVHSHWSYTKPDLKPRTP